MSKLSCYYVHGGLNYKNGFATTCPISGARLKKIDKLWKKDFNQHFENYKRIDDTIVRVK